VPQTFRARRPRVPAEGKTYAYAVQIGEALGPELLSGLRKHQRALGNVLIVKRQNEKVHLNSLTGSLGKRQARFGHEWCPGYIKKWKTRGTVILAAQVKAMKFWNRKRG
jgi:hypothetical protein